MSKNFENLNKKEFASNTLRIGVIATLLWFGALFLIPETIINQIPNSLISITSIAVIYRFMIKYQNKDIQEHLNNNGDKQSGLKVIGIAIISVIISMAFFYALIIFLPETILR